MANQVELIYDINVGIQSGRPGSPLFIKAANIDFDPGGETAALIGMNLIGDVTEAGAENSIIRRRLTYAIEAEGNFAFPSNDLIKAATRNLFGRIFGSALAGFVTAAEPVVS